MAAVPKIIHCVWIGGGDLERYKKYDGLKSWIAEAPDYQIVLWTDNSRLQAALIKKLINKYREINRLYLYAQTVKGKGTPFLGYNWDDTLWNDFLQRIVENTSVSDDIKDVIRAGFNQGRDNQRKLEDDMETLGVVVRDISELQTLPEWAYSVEMSTRGINFAGASDIIRYTALAEFGGVYIDVDLELEKRLPALTTVGGDKNDLLVGILPSAGNDEFTKKAKEVATTFSTNTLDQYQTVEPYVTNALLASPANGKTAADLTKSIRSIYQRMFPRNPDENPKSITIQNYWFSVPTKSTLDITGPNLVRDVLLFNYVEYLQDFSSFSRNRLRYALKGLSSKTDIYEKQFLNYKTDDSRQLLDYEQFNRHAEIWPEESVVYRGFWDWYAEYALFPVDLVNFDTEAAADSATSALLNMKY
jgi:hypothetical protein